MTILSSSAAALTLLLSTGTAAGFTSNARAISKRSSFVGPSLPTSRRMIGGFFNKEEDYEPLVDECLLTPEGFGFSTPMSRILTLSKRASGYYKAGPEESVVDVMAAITEGTIDVALVFDKETLLGIFTESDYIRVSMCVFLDVYVYRCFVVCMCR